MAATLILGGARSGKTRHALTLAERTGARLVMIATAEPGDAEMAARIDRHRAERGPRWRTVEAPLDLPRALRALDADACAVVDCLTLWVSNLLHAGRDLEAEAGELLEALGGPAEVILVSNEVGWGVVPDNALARRFRDVAGRLHQRLAERVDRVVLVAAGLPLVLKG